MTVSFEPRSLNQKRTVQGERTRILILDTAVKEASVNGLENLTIGTLAAHLKMSKSGLFAHFQSKEDLQLSTISHAYIDFRREVIDKARAKSPGIDRLIALCRGWMRYGVTGCLLVNASAEYDGREGPVREAIEQINADWQKTIKDFLLDCQKAEHIKADADIDLLVFELVTLFFGSHIIYHLQSDRRIGVRLKTAVLNRISQVAGAKLDPARLKWFQSEQTR